MNQLNISARFQEGMGQSWGAYDGMRVASGISEKCIGSVFDFDFAAGERWIRVISGRRVISIISVRYPIGFVDSSVCNADCRGLIELPDLDAACLSVDREIIERFAERQFDPSMDLSGISANDIFAMTAT